MAMATVTTMTTIPGYRKFKKEISKPLFVAIPAVTILAEAPSKVPLPPRQAPKLKAQANVVNGTAGSFSAKISITGIIVAVYGMLSRNAEVVALTHTIKVMAVEVCLSSGCFSM